MKNILAILLAVMMCSGCAKTIEILDVWFPNEKKEIIVNDVKYREVQQ